MVSHESIHRSTHTRNNMEQLYRYLALVMNHLIALFTASKLEQEPRANECETNLLMAEPLKLDPNSLLKFATVLLRFFNDSSSVSATSS